VGCPKWGIFEEIGVVLIGICWGFYEFWVCVSFNVEVFIYGVGIFFDVKLLCDEFAYYSVDFAVSV
jgi:hypothetical protein